MTQASYLDRSSRAQTTVVSLATLAGVALLALVLAYWTWIWLAPRPAPRAPGAEARAARLAPAYRLFGGAGKGASAAAPSGLAIELLGVAADSGSEPGYAVFRLESKRAVAVKEGEEIDPGVKLVQVGRDRVVLERGGARETIPLPRKRGK